MRSVILAAGILVASASAAMAQSGQPYEIYVLDPAGAGAQTFVFVGPARSFALEVIRCGEASLMTDGNAVAEQVRARRNDDATNVVNGRMSRAGRCDEGDAGETSNATDTLAVVDNLSPSQMRRFVRGMDAAPEGLREDVLVRLGLRRAS